MIDAVAKRILGYALNLPENVIIRALQPQEIVATRTGLGGAAPEAIKSMIVEARASITEARLWKTQTGNRLAGAEAHLIKIAGDMSEA
jgi:argininosuccinate lyase